MTVKVNGQEWQAGIPAGCSSPNGHYVGKYAILTALEAGWSDAEAERAASEYDENYYRDEWEFFDSWLDILTDATEWLESVTEGGYWLWWEGDFRLVESIECPECGFTIDADSEGECPEHIGWGDL